MRIRIVSNRWRGGIKWICAEVQDRLGDKIGRVGVQARVGEVGGKGKDNT